MWHDMTSQWRVWSFDLGNWPLKFVFKPEVRLFHTNLVKSRTKEPALEKKCLARTIGISVFCANLTAWHRTKTMFFLVHYQHLLAILLQMFCIYTCANVNDRPMSSQDDPLSGHCHVTVSQCHFRVPLPSSPPSIPPSIRCWLTHVCGVVSLCCWNNMISSKCQLFETTDPRVLSFPFPFPCMLYSCSLHIPFISLHFLSCFFHFPFSLIKRISAEQNPPDLHSPDWRSTLIWVS